MNTQRLVVLGLALVAACGAAFLVRGMMGGGTPQVVASAAPTVKMSEVLVAAEPLQPGQPLDAAKVRWEKWPAASVSSTFVTRDAVDSAEDVVKDTVVRAPILKDQPVTTSAIVHGKEAGFMAATLTPGMRAVAILVSTEAGAGGFILPNDHVDLILTQKSNDNPPRVRARTFMRSVRVLAVDQVYKEEKDQRTVLAKTATLELTPAQAETVSRAQGMGQISLSLRPLSAEDAVATANGASAPAREPAGDPLSDMPDSNGPSRPLVAIIRYGIAAKDGSEAQQNVQR
ncbi:MAG TPA: Flp pilus assembly protein CpaB [Rhizomicrobium sp.]|nr:Flp pilus assembly protein CpaB [Rhizomicrobium sp.]